MKNQFLRLVRSISPLAFQRPEGPAGIEEIGHRGYVGGMWDEIGSLQFNFLVSNGLQPHHYLLDIACGSLRLGAKAIPYLNSHHYFGVEKEQELVAAGVRHEVSQELQELKKPKIVISANFDFAQFHQKVYFAVAQSLFSHLPPNDINICFRNLRCTLAEGGGFFTRLILKLSPVNEIRKTHMTMPVFFTQKIKCLSSAKSTALTLPISVIGDIPGVKL